jgi:hypothetical protein
MSRNLRHAGQFKRMLNAGVKRTEGQALQFLKEHAVAFLAEVQHRTPVRSGLLRSSWTASKITPSKWMPISVTSLMSRAQFMNKVSGLKFGQSIHVTNNQPYARRLEHGHGPNNPPTGFVRPSLRSYRKRVRKVKSG